MMRSNVLILLLLACTGASFAKVSLSISGLKATIKNSYVELQFNADATISKALVNGNNIAAVGTKSFYLDWNNNGQGFFTPSSIHIVSQASNRVHFYWLQEGIENLFNIQLHYIMEDTISGIYSYTKYTNDKSYTLTLGETRTVYRFQAALNQGTNKLKCGTIPNGAELGNCESVQDNTWKFSNGTYYTKYDYATYIRQTNYQGVYGGGYGAFVVSPSREYHGGGPLKQDLTVHQDSLITNYFVSCHFGTYGVEAQPGWSHIYGPWLLYFPWGTNEGIIQSVEAQVYNEQSKWPYAWMADDASYPRIRGAVSGVVSGQKSATVVLWDSVEEEFDRQQLGYLYNTETDPSTGYYMINNVRPGNYKIAAYPTAGLGSDVVAESYVTITAGGKEHVQLTLWEPTDIIWSLGEANRLSSEFKYSDQPRNYQFALLPPDTNTFYIGQSDPKENWYYAQSKPGHWYIKYQDTKDGRARKLRVALAAASQKTHLIVKVNDHIVGNTYYENDQSIYRSAMNSGRYYSNVFDVTAAQVVNGENTLELWISLGQIMYDTISLQRV